MRIVSLCPSLTELVFALGRGGDLVGRSRYCVSPAAEVAAVPEVGGTKNPRIEQICALQPDLVLLNQEENRREDAEVLAAAGVRCLVTFPCTIGETAEAVRLVARELEREAAGEELAATIAAAAERVATAATGQPAVSWAYLIWRKPWMTVNAATYIHALLTTAGGRNVFGGLPERYPAITAEQLAAVAPQRVLLASEPFPFQARHADELAALTGLPRPCFHLVDGETLSWHGARTPRGLAYAAQLLLHPPQLAHYPQGVALVGPGQAPAAGGGERQHGAELRLH